MEVEGFEIDREIGRGGFGIVYRARQIALGRLAAIKVIRPDPTRTDIATRFAQECRAIGALPPHPNIVTVYSTGDTSDGRPYLAMQYLGGGSVADRLPLPPEDVVALGCRLADGLRVAHEGGVIHRDVTPANVLYDDDGEPKLVDFGISAMIGSGAATGNEVTASIAYTAPEILRGEPATPAADVYGLGATLFTALSGRKPFADATGRTPLAVLANRIVSEPARGLRPSDVPDALWTVIERCMAKDPGARFASMAELRAALSAVDLAPHGKRGPVFGLSRRVAVAAAAVLVLGAGVATAAVAADGGSKTPEAERHSSAAAQAASDGASEGGRAVFGSSGPTSSARARPGGGDPRYSQAGAAPTSVTTGGTVGSGGSVGTPAGGPGTAPRPVGGTSAGAAPPRAGTHPGSHPTSAPIADRPPVLGPLPVIRTNERTAVSAVFTASDPDGGPLTFHASGVPSGLTVASDGRIGGQGWTKLLYVTHNYKQIGSGSFTVNVTVTDSSNESASGTVTWVLRDTSFVMPNYYGKRGCNGVDGCKESVTNIHNLGPFSTKCVVTKNKNLATHIIGQSVKAGDAATWGQKIVYTVAHLGC